MLTKQLRYAAAVPLSAVLLCVGSARAWADESIEIDFVRHAQSTANAAHVIDTAVPGTSLSQLGRQQAQNIARVLAPKAPFSGIFASQLIRTQQTAAPLASLMGMNVQVSPGLNEINAGIFNGGPEFSLRGLLYLLGPIAWVLGLPFVPMLAPGSTDNNGYVFDKRFTDALRTAYSTELAPTIQGFNDMLQTVYGNALTNPVRNADGKIRALAFSSEFVIEVGVMMNVKNPEQYLMLFDPLPNTGVVVIQGNPHDGWTLVNWNGKSIAPAWAGAQTSRETPDLCQLLMPTQTGPCVAKPPSTASAPPVGSATENPVSERLPAASWSAPSTAVPPRR